MELTSALVADLRELINESPDSLELSFSPAGASLGAIVELACLRASLRHQLRQRFNEWALQFPLMLQAFKTLDVGQLPSPEKMWEPRSVDFLPVRGRNWRNTPACGTFQSRFVKGAKECGFGKKAEGLCGAILEIADNITQHSAPQSAPPVPGLIGYHLENGYVTFAVGDTGQGVLASLKNNPLWAPLETETEALMAIVEKHASRRVHAGEGEGFKQFFKALVDLNGAVDLRSLEGRVTVRSDSHGRIASPTYVGKVPGLQVIVRCSLSRANNERNCC